MAGVLDPIRHLEVARTLPSLRHEATHPHFLGVVVMVETIFPLLLFVLRIVDHMAVRVDHTDLLQQL